MADNRLPKPREEESRLASDPEAIELAAIERATRMLYRRIFVFRSRHHRCPENCPLCTALESNFTGIDVFDMLTTLQNVTGLGMSSLKAGRPRVKGDKREPRGKSR